MTKPRRKVLPPRTPAQLERLRLWTMPIVTRVVPGKTWGGRLISHTELPTGGRRLFKLDEEDLSLLGFIDTERETE